METLEQTRCNVADLHWLATLLTGCRGTAGEVTPQTPSPVEEAGTSFSTWMDAWSRRIFIAKTLVAVRQDLAEAARRTALRGAEKSELPPRSWTLDRKTTRSDLERALLPMDAFRRAAVLLLLFERVPLKDAAILLDSEPDLVREAQAVGVRELTVNLAREQGQESVRTDKAEPMRIVSDQRKVRPDFFERLGSYSCRLMHHSAMWLGRSVRQDTAASL